MFKTKAENWLEQSSYLSEVSLEEAFQIQIREFLVDEEDLYVDVFSVFVEEVLEEVGDGLEGDVSADDDVLLAVVRFVFSGIFGSFAHNLKDLRDGRGKKTQTEANEEYCEHFACKMGKRGGT